MTLHMQKAIEQASHRASLLLETAKSGYGKLGRIISSLAGTGGLDPVTRNVNNLALHAEQLRHFQGFPYAIIRTIANRIAGQPLRIARRVPQGERQSKRQAIKSFALQRKRHVPKSMQGDTENLEHLEDHPLLKTFARPNPFMIRSALMFQTISSLELTGKAYWWVLDDYGTDGNDPSPDLVPGPLTIWPLPSSWVEPHHEEGELYKEWWLQPAGTGEKFAVPASQIVYFYYPDPANPLGATSPLQALAKSIVADESIEEAQRRAFINGCNPGLAVIVGQWPEMQAAGVQSQAVLTRDQRNALVTMLKQQYRGVVNQDEPLILDGLIKDVKPITTAPAEMDFLNSSKATKERLSLGWGTNPIVMGQVEGANRASSAVADDHFVANVINPRLGMMSEVMTIYLAPRLAEDGEDLVLYLEAAHSVDIDYDLSVEMAMVERAAMSRNEWRQRHHMQPLADGDSVIVGGTEIPVEIAPEDGVKRRKRKPRRLLPPAKPPSTQPVRPGGSKSGRQKVDASGKYSSGKDTPGIDEDVVAEAAEQLSRNPDKSPDYGQAYVHQGKQAVWYTLADGDGREIQSIAERTFGAIAGVETVEFGDEGPPPFNAGWRMVWPKKQDHTREFAAHGGPAAGGGAASTKCPGTAYPDELLAVPDVQQDDDYSCGACAAAAVGSFFGVGPGVDAEGLEQWKEELGTNEAQATLPAAIIAYLAELGLSVTPASGMTIADLRDCWRAGYPVICPVQDYGVPSSQASYSFGHYVVVVGAALGYVFIQDSSVGVDEERDDGKIMIPEEEWLDVWHDEDADGEVYYRYGIIVGPPDARKGKAWQSMAAELERKARHDYSSTHLVVTGETRAAALEMSESIPDEDIYQEERDDGSIGKGRETNPHITIKYGLHTRNPEDVQELVSGFGVVEVKLGTSSVFEVEGYDVVKLDVAGDSLHRLNAALSSGLEHTDKHPEYQPHLTLAYVQPGRGQSYSNMDALDGVMLHFDSFTFTDPDGKETVISLAPPARGRSGRRASARRDGKCGGEGGTPGPCADGGGAGGSGGDDKPVGKPASDAMAQHLPGVNPDKPLSDKHESKVESKSQSRVRRIMGAITSLPGKAVPQAIKDKVSAIKGAIVKKMQDRYGERGANIILKVAAISAPVPFPGSQPIAIATSLLIAEGVLLVNKLRARPAASPAVASWNGTGLGLPGWKDSDWKDGKPLTAGQIAAASDLFTSDCQRDMQDALDAAEEEEDPGNADSSTEEEKAGFFEECDRDDDGHCKPGSGGGSGGNPDSGGTPVSSDSGSDVDGGEGSGDEGGRARPETDEEYQAALAEHEEEHAAWEEESARVDQEHEQAMAEHEEEHAAWEAQSEQAQQKFDADHEAWQEAYSAAEQEYNEATQKAEEQGERLTSEYREVQAAWQERQDARDAIKEKLDGGNVERAMEGVSIVGPSMTGLSHEEHQAASAALPGEVREKYGAAAGKLDEALEGLGASEADRARVAATAAKLTESVGKEADKYAKMAGDYGEFMANEYRPHEGSEPEAPDEPEDPGDEATPEEQAAYDEAMKDYEKADAQYTAAHEAWEEKMESLNETDSKHWDKLDAQSDKLSDADDAAKEKLSDMVGKIEEKRQAQLDKEEDKDAEPEEPELPDLPDLDDFTSGVGDEPDIDEYMADVPDEPEPPEHPGYDPEPLPPLKPGSGETGKASRRRAGTRSGKAGGFARARGDRGNGGRNGGSGGSGGGQRGSKQGRRLRPCLLDRLDERGYLGIWSKQVDRFTIPFARSMNRFFRSLRSGALKALEEALESPTGGTLSPATIDQALHSSEWEAGLLQEALPHIEDTVAAGAILEWELNKPSFHRGLVNPGVRIPLAISGSPASRAGARAGARAVSGDRLRVDMDTLPPSVRQEVRALVAELMGADSWKEVVPKIRLDLYEAINNLARGDQRTRPLSGRKLAAAAVKKVLGVSASSRRADRIARTEASAATNGGQSVSRERLSKLGVIRAKQWVATLDSVTRDDHEAGHGQVVAPDEDFTIGGYIAAYPGDPALPASQRCNCRCVVRSIRGKE